MAWTQGTLATAAAIVTPIAVLVGVLVVIAAGVCLLSWILEHR